MFFEETIRGKKEFKKEKRMYKGKIYEKNIFKIKKKRKKKKE